MYFTVTEKNSVTEKLVFLKKVTKQNQIINFFKKILKTEGN